MVCVYIYEILARIRFYTEQLCGGDLRTSGGLIPFAVLSDQTMQDGSRNKING